MKRLIFFSLIILSASCKKQQYDIVIRGGTVYDGTGAAGKLTDVAINADTIAVIGDLSKAVGKTEIDAKGMAGTPGFINIMSPSQVSLFFYCDLPSGIPQGV